MHEQNPRLRVENNREFLQVNEAQEIGCSSIRFFIVNRPLKNRFFLVSMY